MKRFIEVLPSRLCSGDCRPSGYQPLNECFVETLHSRLRGDGAGEPRDYQPFTWPFIAILLSHVGDDRFGEPSRYQAFRLERIGTSLRGFALHGRDDRAHA